MKKWQLQQAKARFSEVVRRAGAEGPQEITVRGKRAAVVLSAEDFERLNERKPRFVAFMRASPLRGVELELERDASPMREVEL